MPDGGMQAPHCESAQAGVGDSAKHSMKCAIISGAVNAGPKPYHYRSGEANSSLGWRHFSCHFRRAEQINLEPQIKLGPQLG
jgi:hypothetical protein